MATNKRPIMTNWAIHVVTSVPQYAPVSCLSTNVQPKSRTDWPMIFSAGPTAAYLWPSYSARAIW